MRDVQLFFYSLLEQKQQFVILILRKIMYHTVLRDPLWRKFLVISCKSDYNSDINSLCGNELNPLSHSHFPSLKLVIFNHMYNFVRNFMMTKVNNTWEVSEAIFNLSMRGFVLIWQLFMEDLFCYNPIFGSCLYVVFATWRTS